MYKQLLQSRRCMVKNVYWLVLLLFLPVLLYKIGLEHKWKSQRTDITRSSLRSTIFTSEVPRTKKVLLYTYMRGGSSYFGEIFHQNPDAVYWFEPMDSFYQGMFGMRALMKPLNILYYRNQTKRYISNLEVQEIVAFHQNLFSCEYAKVPMMTFANIHNSKCSMKFAGCGSTIYSVGKCLEHLTGICTASTVIRGDPLTTNAIYAMKNRCFNAIKAGLEEEPLQVDTVEQAEAFEKYLECHQTAKELFLKTCYPRIQDTCQHKTIQAVKNIRLTMDTIEQLMVEIPDIHMVFVVRDPRGIIASRLALPTLFTFKPLAETHILCSRMVHDLSIFRRLEQRYPGRVLLQKYENFAKDPIVETEKTYKLLDEVVPQKVTEWLRKASSNDHNPKKTRGKFTTVRRNSTDVSVSWRRELHLSLIEQLTEICHDIITELNYDA